VANMLLLASGRVGLLELLPLTLRLAVLRDEDACATRVTTARPRSPLKLMEGWLSVGLMLVTAILPGGHSIMRATGPISG
jgi:hypothetical protein